jgi:phosphosulfolactate phosphohydrolase-like enzyme
MGTFVITNIMAMWSLACVFDADRKVTFTLEDMPINLAGIIVGIILGKIGQSYVENKAAENKTMEGK